MPKSFLFEKDLSISGVYKPLPFQDEIALSKRIQAGERGKKQLTEKNNLSPEEYSSLSNIIEDGKDAYDQLVLSNIPRAVKIAAATYRKNTAGLNCVEDYFQSAMKIICICAKSYDGRCRFGSYVHKSLLREMLHENALTRFAIKIPEDSLPHITKLKKLLETEDLEMAVEILGIRRKEAEKLLIMCKPAKSMQDPIFDENEELDFGDTIQDQYAINSAEIDEKIVWDQAISEMIRSLSKLPNDEMALLKNRYGLDGEPQPMRAFVGSTAKSISAVQKNQIKAEKNLLRLMNEENLTDWKIELFE